MITSMKPFVDKHSIVRSIWGKADTVLFIFAGAAAEFSLNKAVDWLYFTGRLPADPIGRLFSTVGYARQIIFAPEEKALEAIGRMRTIHTAVENNRGYAIPDRAYQDVLYMLIHYSIAAYELSERKLSPPEKEDIYHVFYEVGTHMGIPGLPAHFTDWLPVREQQLLENLEKSHYTTDLYKQYKKHLGALRYNILLKVQSRLLPHTALAMLELKPSRILPLLLPAYKMAGVLGLQGLIKRIFLPAQYRRQIQELNMPHRP